MLNTLQVQTDFIDLIIDQQNGKAICKNLGKILEMKHRILLTTEGLVKVGEKCSAINRLRIC
jgi:hypothetical protein